MSERSAIVAPGTGSGNGDTPTPPRLPAFPTESRGSAFVPGAWVDTLHYSYSNRLPTHAESKPGGPFVRSGVQERNESR